MGQASRHLQDRAVGDVVFLLEQYCNQWDLQRRQCTPYRSEAPVAWAVGRRSLLHHQRLRDRCAGVSEVSVYDTGTAILSWGS